MTYSEALAELAMRVDALDARRKAALFWLLGSGLLRRLQPPGVWLRWAEEAHMRGWQYAARGEVPAGAEGLWEQAQASTGYDSSQLLNSTIICLSTPLGLATGRCTSVGTWLEHGFLPLIQQESLRLFDDVAFPDDDDDLDQVFDQLIVQQAFDACRSVVGSLEALSDPPNGGVLEALLPDAARIAPSTE